MNRRQQPYEEECADNYPYGEQEHQGVGGICFFANRVGFGVIAGCQHVEGMKLSNPYGYGYQVSLVVHSQDGHRGARVLYSGKHRWTRRKQGGVKSEAT